MWHSFNSFGYGMHSPFLAIWGPIFGIWALVALALKGYALWHAAKRNETWWFVALLILNTMGILELIYIGVVLKKFNNINQHFSNGSPSTPSASSEKTSEKKEEAADQTPPASQN